MSWPNSACCRAEGTSSSTHTRRLRWITCSARSPRARCKELAHHCQGRRAGQRRGGNTESLKRSPTTRCACASSTAGVGAINESDVMLANAGNAIIIGFNVRPDPVAEEEAAQAESGAAHCTASSTTPSKRCHRRHEGHAGAQVPRGGAGPRRGAQTCSRYLPRAPLPAATCWRAR